MGGSVLLLHHMPSRGAQGQIYWPNINIILCLLLLATQSLNAACSLQCSETLELGL
jgi:K+ transporter